MPAPLKGYMRRATETVSSKYTLDDDERNEVLAAVTRRVLPRLLDREHRSGWKGQARLSTWIHRIALNAAYDVAARRSARDVTSFTDGVHGGTAQSSEREFDVRRLLERATPLERRVAALVMEGHSPTCAAQILRRETGEVFYTKRVRDILEGLGKKL